LLYYFNLVKILLSIVSLKTDPKDKGRINNSYLVVLKNYECGSKTMYKCPKCGYESAEAGNCPTDQEVLVAIVEAPAVEPQAPVEAPDQTETPAA